MIAEILPAAKVTETSRTAAEATEALCEGLRPQAWGDSAISGDRASLASMRAARAAGQSQVSIQPTMPFGKNMMSAIRTGPEHHHAIVLQRLQVLAQPGDDERADDGAEQRTHAPTMT